MSRLPSCLNTYVCFDQGYSPDGAKPATSLYTFPRPSNVKLDLNNILFLHCALILATNID